MFHFRCLLSRQPHPPSLGSFQLLSGGVELRTTESMVVSMMRTNRDTALEDVDLIHLNFPFGLSSPLIIPIAVREQSRYEVVAVRRLQRSRRFLHVFDWSGVHGFRYEVGEHVSEIFGLGGNVAEVHENHVASTYHGLVTK